METLRYTQEVHYQPRETLRDEVDYLKQNWRQEGLSSDWRLLSKTGFQVGTHVDMLYDTFDQLDTENDSADKIDQWLVQTEEDIKGFNLEYLAEGLVFPIFYKIDREKGKVIAPLYGDKSIEDIVSDQERNGVVKRTVANTLTPIFLHAPDNSIAVMHSPSGWSGLTTQGGEAITFPDSQTYIFQKKQDEIVGFTIRTDFENQEHRELIQRIGGKQLAEDAAVEEYVSSVGFINGENFPESDISDVVQQMRIVRFENQGTDLAYKDRSWSEVFDGLNNRDNLWKFDEETKKLVEEFKDWVLTTDWTRVELEEALAVTILRISSVLTGTGKLPTIVADGYEYVDAKHGSNILDYGAVLGEVEARGGCAGGGNGGALDQFLNSDQFLINSLTPRYGTESSGDSLFSCPKCPFVTDKPVGDSCPGCGLTKEQFAKQGGEVC